MPPRKRPEKIRHFKRDADAVLIWWQHHHTDSARRQERPIDRLPDTGRLRATSSAARPDHFKVRWRKVETPLFSCERDAEEPEVLRFTHHSVVAESRLDLALVAMRAIARRTGRVTRLLVKMYSEEYSVLPTGEIQKRAIEPKSIPATAEALA